MSSVFTTPLAYVSQVVRGITRFWSDFNFFHQCPLVHRTTASYVYLGLWIWYLPSSPTLTPIFNSDSLHLRKSLSICSSLILWSRWHLALSTFIFFNLFFNSLMYFFSFCKIIYSIKFSPWHTKCTTVPYIEVLIHQMYCSTLHLS